MSKVAPFPLLPTLPPQTQSAAGQTLTSPNPSPVTLSANSTPAVGLVPPGANGMEPILLSAVALAPPKAVSSRSLMPDNKEDQERIEQIIDIHKFELEQLTKKSALTKEKMKNINETLLSIHKLEYEVKFMDLITLKKYTLNKIAESQMAAYLKHRHKLANLYLLQQKIHEISNEEVTRRSLLKISTQKRYNSTNKFQEVLGLPNDQILSSQDKQRIYAALKTEIDAFKQLLELYVDASNTIFDLSNILVMYLRKKDINALEEALASNLEAIKKLTTHTDNAPLFTFDDLIASYKKARACCSIM